MLSCADTLAVCGSAPASDANAVATASKPHCHPPPRLFGRFWRKTVIGPGVLIAHAARASHIPWSATPALGHAAGRNADFHQNPPRDPDSPAPEHKLGLAPLLQGPASSPPIARPGFAHTMELSKRSRRGSHDPLLQSWTIFAAAPRKPPVSDEPYSTASDPATPRYRAALAPALRPHVKQFDKVNPM